MPAPGLRSAPSLAPWHAQRPHLAINAMMQARASASHLAPLIDFLVPWLPRRPLASANIRSVAVRDRYADPMLLDDAVTMPWLAFDGTDARNVIAIDVDHADGPDRTEALAAYGLPRPTLVIDPWSGRSHAVWRLATPVLTGEGARLGPQKLLHVAGSMLAAAMGGTLMPPRALLKSPWGLLENLQGHRLRRGDVPAMPSLWEAYNASGTSLMWHTVPGDLRPVELREIVAALADDYAAAMPAPVRRWHKQRGEPSALGRNSALFDLTRWWAYDRIERDGGAIHDEAMRVNATFATPLPANEVAATARSIARFMNTRFGRKASRAARRDDEAGQGMTPEQKRSLAGRASADAVIARTNDKIMRGIEALRAAGARVTQKALAAVSGMSLRTIASRWATVVADIACKALPPIRFLRGPRALVTRCGTSFPCEIKPSLPASTPQCASSSGTDPPKPES